MARSRLPRTEIPYAIPPRFVLPDPVPKGRSSAANQNAPSFLDLPGELRNRIYALTFLYPDPLMIGHVSSKLRLYRRAGDQNGPNYVGPLERGDVRHNLLELDLRYGIVLCCRQVYYESVSIFYSQNLFTVARRPMSCDAEALFIGMPMQLLLNLGPQLPLLKNVIIDMATLCRRNCERYEETIIQQGLGSGYLYMWDLLRVLWSGDWNFEITFIDERRTGSIAYEGNYAEHREQRYDRPAYWPFSARYFTRLMRTLRRDELGMKKWIDLIYILVVFESGIDGYILFRSTHFECSSNTKLWGYHPCLENALAFTSNFGRDLRILRPTPSLQTIPVKLQRQILCDTLCEAGLVIIDVDHDLPATASTPTRLLVSKQIYERHSSSLKSVYWSSHFEFVMHSDTSPTSFSDFQALKNWMHLGASPEPPFRGLYTENLAKAKSIKLSMEFDLPNHTAGLSGVEFNAIPLILAMAHIAARNSHGAENRILVKVVVTTNSYQDGTPNRETHEFSLKEPHHTVLVKLMRLSKRDPSIEHEQCPDVMINGYGRAEDCKSDNVKNGKTCKSSGLEGLDWDPEWIKQPGCFDGTTVCFMNYLWRMFTGGDADACAKRCFYYWDMSMSDFATLFGPMTI